jgi:hypothetical protein
VCFIDRAISLRERAAIFFSLLLFERDEREKWKGNKKKKKKRRGFFLIDLSAGGNMGLYKKRKGKERE